MEPLHWLSALQQGGVGREGEREKGRHMGEGGAGGQRSCWEIGNARQLRLPIIAHQPARCYWGSRAQAVRRAETLSAEWYTRAETHTQKQAEREGAREEGAHQHMQRRGGLRRSRAVGREEERGEGGVSKRSRSNWDSLRSRSRRSSQAHH